MQPSDLVSAFYTLGTIYLCNQITKIQKLKIQPILQPPSNCLILKSFLFPKKKRFFRSTPNFCDAIQIYDLARFMLMLCCALQTQPQQNTTKVDFESDHRKETGHYL